MQILFNHKALKKEGRGSQWGGRRIETQISPHTTGVCYGGSQCGRLHSSVRSSSYVGIVTRTENNQVVTLRITADELARLNQAAAEHFC